MRLSEIQSLKSKVVSHLDQNSHLMVLVHGRTGNLKMLEWMAKRFEIPSLSYLSIQAPYEDLRSDQKPGEGYSWYLEGKKGIEESRKLLLKTVEEIEAQGWKAHQIFWMGFSQGAAMSLDLALRGPFTFAGVLAISGFCVQSSEYPEAFGPQAKNQRILITHGKRDETISLEQAEASYEPLRRFGIPFEFQVFDKPHSFHLKSEVPLLEDQIKSWMESLQKA